MTTTTPSLPEQLPESNPSSGDKRALDLAQIAEDLSLSNEEGTTWYHYRLPPAAVHVGGQHALLVDEYDDLGMVIATHKMWIEIEFDDRGTVALGGATWTAE
jgi:hypothetical protein